MNPNFLRGQLLYQQDRHAEAERELRQALAADPNDTQSLALLSSCLADQGKFNRAISAARQAIGLSPDDAYLHYIHARTLHLADRISSALAAVNEAIRLAPDSDDCFSLRAGILLDRDETEDSLRSAEQALALNPEHVTAANLRSMALVKLGRKKEAAQTIAYALQKEPENHLSHANQGWNELRLNRPRKAQEHFAEALRLKPDFEYARKGMLEALKARNPIYRGMLAYFLWMEQQSGRMQWVFIVGTLIAQRMLQGLAKISPQSSPVIWSILAVFYLFIYMSWVAGPLFNLLLRFNKFGRFVLSADERIASNWFATALFPALGALIAFFCGWPPGAMLALVLAVTSVCIAATFASEGGVRTLIGFASTGMFLFGIGGLAFVLYNQTPRQKEAFIAVFIMAFLLFQILVNILRRRFQS